MRDLHTVSWVWVLGIVKWQHIIGRWESVLGKLVHLQPKHYNGNVFGSQGVILAPEQTIEHYLDADIHIPLVIMYLAMTRTFISKFKIINLENVRYFISLYKVFYLILITNNFYGTSCLTYFRMIKYRQSSFYFNLKYTFILNVMSDFKFCIS